MISISSIYKCAKFRGASVSNGEYGIAIAVLGTLLIDLTTSQKPLYLHCPKCAEFMGLHNPLTPEGFFRHLIHTVVDESCLLKSLHGKVLEDASLHFRREREEFRR